jgi:DNA-binding NtrC family response regulator
MDKRATISFMPMEQRAGTILIVDDFDSLLRVLSITLQGRGYRVLHARSAAEAIRLYRDHSSEIHLVITDVEMPEMRGPELIAELSRLGCSAPVLYMSGFHDHTAFGEQVAARTVHFLKKPFLPGALADKVRELLAPAV